MFGVPGDYRTQFHVKAKAMADALSSGTYDFGFLHIKAVDDTGHDQQPVLKVTICLAHAKHARKQQQRICLFCS